MKSTFLVSKGLLCLYDKQNNTSIWLLVDMKFLFSFSTRHLTCSLRSLTGYPVKHSKINFHIYWHANVFILYFLNKWMTVAQLYLVSYPRSDAKPLSGSITSIKITPKNEHWSLLVLVLLLVFRVSSIVEGRGINRTKPDSWLVESRATGACNILAYVNHSNNSKLNAGFP